MAGGKSYLLRWASLYYAMWLTIEFNIRNAPIGVFCEDYPTLKDRQISRIAKEFPEWVGRLKDDSVYGLSFQIDEHYGGGVLLLRNLDDPSKYMSTEFAGIFVDELTRNEEQTFQDLRNRLRYPGVEQVKFMGATNPGGIGHSWVKKLFVDKNSDDPEQDRFIYVHANVYDNEYVNKNYIKQLESLPEQKRKAYLEGSWDVFEGQIFTEFNRNFHIIRPITPRMDSPHYLGIDWGYSAPFACLASAIIQMKDDESGEVFNRVVTYQEWYASEKHPEEWAEIIYKQAICRDFRKAIFDSSCFNVSTDGSKSIAEKMQDKWRKLNGNLWTVLEKGTKNRIGRIATTHDWLSTAPDGLPYWLITENCINLIRTLPMLVYDENKKEDVDQKGSIDHAWDAVSYSLGYVKFIQAVGSFGSREVRRRKFRVNRSLGITQEGQPAIDLRYFEKSGVQKDWKSV